MPISGIGILPDLPPELGPTALSQYLGSQSWECIQRDSEALEIWRAPDVQIGLRPVVLLPFDRDFEDYEIRLGEAVSSIQGYYSLSLLQLVERVATLHSDLLFIRLDQFSTDGTIPLKQAGQLLENIETMFRSAATTVISPSHSHAGRRPARVYEFMNDDLRLGHTKHGSFIITVVARHDQLQDDRSPGLNVSDASNDPESVKRTDPEAIAIAPDLMEEFRDQANVGRGLAPSVDSSSGAVMPLARRVMLTLSRSLELTKDSLLSGAGQLAPGAEQEGVSVELVESIQRIGAQEGLTAVDVTFDWAVAQPPPAGVRSEIRFDRADIELLPAISETLRRRVRPTEVTLMGQVTNLSRPDLPDDDNSIPDGEIVLNAPLEGRMRNIVIPLSGSDYAWAIIAHQNYWPFTVTGAVERKGRWRLGGNIQVDTEFLERMYTAERQPKSPPES